RYRAVSAQVRKQEAMLFHLRWTNAKTEVLDAEEARARSIREVAATTIAQTEASKHQETVASEVPPLREAEAKAAAGLQRLVMAREELDREEVRARERLAELDRRLVQLDEDIKHERQLATDAEWALKRLGAEQDALNGDLQAGEGRRSEVGQKVSAA